MFKRGDLVLVRMAKNKQNGDPDYQERIVWDFNGTIVDVCHEDEYNKSCNDQLGIVMINSKAFMELPWHVGVPARDVLYPQNQPL